MLDVRGAAAWRAARPSEEGFDLAVVGRPRDVVPFRFVVARSAARAGVAGGGAVFCILLVVEKLRRRRAVGGGQTAGLAARGLARLCARGVARRALQAGLQQRTGLVARGIAVLAHGTVCAIRHSELFAELALFAFQAPRRPCVRRGPPCRASLARRVATLGGLKASRITLDACFRAGLDGHGAAVARRARGLAFRVLVVSLRAIDACGSIVFVYFLRVDAVPTFGAIFALRAGGVAELPRAARRALGAAF